MFASVLLVGVACVCMSKRLLITINEIRDSDGEYSVDGRWRGKGRETGSNGGQSRGIHVICNYRFRGISRFVPLRHFLLLARLVVGFSASRAGSHV